MLRFFSPIALVVLALVPGILAADERALIALKPEQQQEILSDMQHHLESLDEIIGYLAEGDTGSAARIAERKLGPGGGRNRPAILRSYVPEAMRGLGRSMHNSALRLARVLRAATDDPPEEAFPKIMEALQALTSTCVDCHATYRIR